MKYPGKESATLEFKEKTPENHQVINTIIGFCNQFGGRVIIGVRDDGELIGLPEDKIDSIMNTLQESIYKSCTPPIIPLIHAQCLDDKLVIIIEVSSGMNKPYFRTSLGLNEGCYIRLGASTMKATPSMIQELQWQARGHNADEFPIYRATMEDLNDQTFENFFVRRKIDFDKSNIKILLKHYQCITEEHFRIYPTTAGILLFGKNPQQFLSEAFVICTHFNGTNGRDTLATRDCVGNLFQQLTDCMAFLNDRLYKSFTINALHRDEHLEIPANALREMVLNALVHRNYHIPGPIKIAIYDDRVEIFSPGNFPGPLKMDELEYGVTYVRNKVINKIFREMGLSEKLGSGFRTLFKEYRDRQLPKPDVIEGTGFIKCILPRATTLLGGSVEIEQNEEAIMKLFYMKEAITSQDIVKQFSVSRQTAVRWLTKLAKKGLIDKMGTGAGMRYRKAQ